MSVPTSTAYPCVGCPITPCLASGYRNVSAPITIRCSASTVGWPTCASSRSRRSNRFRTRRFRIRSLNGAVFRTGRGTVRREYLDHIFFWNAIDLTRKLDAFADYYNAHRVHRSLDCTTPARRACASSSSPARAALGQYAWKQHCRGLFPTPTPA